MKEPRFRQGEFVIFPNIYGFNSIIKIEIWDHKNDEYVYWWYNSDGTNKDKTHLDKYPMNFNFDGSYATATSEVEAGRSLGFDEEIVRMLFL